jgi:hypothetical protein
MSLSDEYRVVAARADLLAKPQNPPTGKVHALMRDADATICGKVEALDVVYLKHDMPGHSFIVTCPDCLKALKKERQRRSRDGTARYQQRQAEVREAFKRDDECEVSIDGVPVSGEEREVLIIALRMYIDGPAGEVGSNEIAESMMARIAGEA